MKKIFTLLFSVSLVGSVFAQGGHQDRLKVSNEVAFNKSPESLMNNYSSNHGVYSMYNVDRDRRVREINKDFDRQIMQIKFNWRLRPFEKERMIRMLEFQRNQKIRELNDHNMDHDRGGFNHKW